VSIGGQQAGAARPFGSPGSASAQTCVGAEQSLISGLEGSEAVFPLLRASVRASGPGSGGSLTE